MSKGSLTSKEARLVDQQDEILVERAEVDVRGRLGAAPRQQPQPGSLHAPERRLSLPRTAAMAREGSAEEAEPVRLEIVPR